MDKDLNLSPALGVPVHGIIGYDVFRDFVVEVNYGKSIIKLYNNNEAFKVPKKAQKLTLAIEHKKAFLHASIVRESNKEVPVKLLVDTGSSDALWLFKDSIKGI